MAGKTKTTSSKVTYVIHSKAELKEARWLIKEGVYRSLLEYRKSMEHAGEIFAEMDRAKKAKRSAKAKLKQAA